MDDKKVMTLDGPDDAAYERIRKYCEEHGLLEELDKPLEEEEYLDD